LKTVPHPVLQLELPPKLVVGVRWVLVHFVSAVLILGSVAAFGQSQRPADPEISYLVRVQRATPVNTICVLLRHDGQFHLETSHGDRTKVLEGSLPSDESRIVESSASSCPTGRSSGNQ
jgi:hypothetical protein